MAIIEPLLFPCFVKTTLPDSQSRARGILSARRLISNRLGFPVQERSRVYNQEEVVIPLILTRPMVG
jgi:hypothetical protein